MDPVGGLAGLLGQALDLLGDDAEGAAGLAARAASTLALRERSLVCEATRRTRPTTSSIWWERVSSSRTMPPTWSVKSSACWTPPVIAWRFSAICWAELAICAAWLACVLDASSSFSENEKSWGTFS